MFKRPFLPAWIWLAVVTALSVMPGVPMPKFNLFSSDKLGHAAAYGVLAWLIWRGWKRVRTSALTTRELWIIFALSSGYGVLMECVQGAFFPYRFFEFDDMLANAFGAALAMGAAALSKNKKAA